MKRLRSLLQKKEGTTLVETMVCLLLISIMLAMAASALSAASRIFVRVQRMQYAQSILDTAMTELRTITQNASGYVKIYDIPADSVEKSENITGNITKSTGKFTKEEIASLAELGKDTIINVTVENNKIKTLVYDNGQKRCTYNPANSKNNSDGDYNVGKSGEDTTTGGNTN